MKLAIIGGGAAGFFLAVNLKRMSPSLDITIFEKKSTVLAKVKISGGGRCNLTNSFVGISDMSKAYPRGAKFIKKSFKTFDYRDTYDWFEYNGVPLVTQDDECVFPMSQDSQSVIDCFMDQCEDLGVNIKVLHTLINISKQSDESFLLSFEEVGDMVFDMVAITTGGHSKANSFDYLAALGHHIEPPVPSLFTFNMPQDPVRSLMGVVQENATVCLQGTRIKGSGALLITHWGMSGPAILKLSSYAARLIHQKQYEFVISVNWVGDSNFDRIKQELEDIVWSNPNKLVVNIRPYGITSRLWDFLLEKADVSLTKKWNELGKTAINRLVNILINDEYKVHGKGRFRDEFVTCGGVSLESVDQSTMESLSVPNLYFAGEVLDIDAITGGFNLQAAWTSAYVVARAISERVDI